jgi:ubiquinone biosynthesis accessory factor UbiJ
MLEQPISAVAASILNHLLQAASWAREALQAHAGKSFLVQGPLGALHLSVAADGLVRRASADAAQDVRIALSAGQWMRLTAGNKAVLKEARIEGDAEFSAALLHVAEHLEWEYEEDLSRVVGDVAAHRIGEGVRRARAWREDAGARTAQTFAEYLTEEKSVIAKRAAVEEFAREVERVRAEVEALEARIQKLGA